MSEELGPLTRSTQTLHNNTGKPAPLALGKHQTLRACLRLGNCFVDRQGQLSIPPPPSTAPTPSHAASCAFGSSYGSSGAQTPSAAGGRPGLRKGSSGVASLFASMRFHRDSSSISASNHNKETAAAAAVTTRHHLSYGGAGDPGATTGSSLGLDDAMTRTCMHDWFA